MRLVCLLLILTLAAGVYIYRMDMIQDRAQETQIRVLQAKVDALQLIAAGRILAQEDGREKRVSNGGIRY